MRNIINKIRETSLKYSLERKFLESNSFLRYSNFLRSSNPLRYKNFLRNNALLRVLNILLIAILISSSQIIEALTAQEVFKKVNQSIVTMISPKLEKGQLYLSQGGGVAVTPTILVTNCHVALAGSTIFAQVGDDFLVGKVIYKNTEHDLCIVEVPSGKFSPVNIRNSSDVEIGEVVYAIGNPEGLEKTLTQGLISGKREYKGGIWLQTDATISHGSSGGGLFDAQGNLIGITTAKLADVNIGFAIPTEWIKTALSGPRIPENTTDENRTLPGTENISEEKSVDKSTKTTQKNNKKENAKKNTEIPKANPIYEYPKIEDLGQFGKSRIGVFKVKGQCAIAIPGIDDNGVIVSYAIWLKSAPESIVFLPEAATPYIAFQQLNEFAQNPNYQNKLTLSKNYIFLGDQVQELIGTQSVKGNYAIQIAQFNGDARKSLVEGRRFVVQFKEPQRKTGYSAVQYSLSGITDAMNAIQNQCVND